ncbi:MAG: GDP-mannose 4,6-dehydratase [Anaerolineae bacterium]|nr:GDP-mannose 4,6-dehydratase [Anaerolineae bacterium]
MRVFVTGATGFAGTHLVNDLLEQGHQVYGLVYRGDSRRYETTSAAYTPIEGDLQDLASLKEAVVAAKPDVIYHLAGWALTAESWRDPARVLAINTGGTANLLEAALAVGRPRVVAVTSAEIYGQVTAADLPITERSIPDPRHPYGLSKWAAGQLVGLYWQRYQLPVLEARPFNHIGPGQEPGFVVPDFASQLAAIALGLREPQMLVGNLDAERDFTDVRDVVRAYQRLASDGRPGGTYIIASGQPVPIHYLLTTLIQIAGIGVEVTYDPERMRPSDVPVLYGSYARLEQDTGWRPEIHLRQSLHDAYYGWHERLRREQESVP